MGEVMISSRPRVFGAAAEPAPPARRVAIVVNPQARHASSAIAELVGQCRARGLETPSSWPTTPDEPGALQARKAVASGAELVIAIGGDGTVRQVARSLAGTNSRLGIIALGSGNVLAHNLGLAGLPISEQVAVCLGGASAALDLGWAHGHTAAGDEFDEPFLTMAGIGRDAETVAHTEFAAKKRLGWFAYALAGAQQAVRPPIPMRVQLDDQPARDVCTWTVLAGITPIAPGGVLIHPNALADDGLLNVLEVPLTHLGQWLPVAVKGLTHHDRQVAALHYACAQRLQVWPSSPQPVQADGDVIEQVTWLEVSIQTRSVHIQLLADRGAGS